MSPKVLWDVVRTAAARAGIDKLAPHDLRRTCARLCHLAGGELDQIQFLLGHVSIQTTERYLGCKQKLRIAVNDRLGIEPDGRLNGPTARAEASVRPGRLLVTNPSAFGSRLDQTMPVLVEALLPECGLREAWSGTGNPPQSRAGINDTSTPSTRRHKDSS